MSSHHIIRENQEPALLIVDIQAIDEELLGQLLEWSPMVMTTGEHLDFLLSRGIKVDVVFATKELPVEILQEDTFVVLCDRTQPFRDILTHLTSKKQFALHVLCDQAYLKQELCYDDRFTIVVFSNNIRYISVASFEKWLPKGQVLFVDHAVGQYRTEGLISMGGNEYQVEEDGFVRVATIDGHKIWIGEQLWI